MQGYLKYMGEQMLSTLSCFIAGTSQEEQSIISVMPRKGR
jgi:hypothetical protein